MATSPETTITPVEAVEANLSPVTPMAEPTPAITPTTVTLNKHATTQVKSGNVVASASVAAGVVSTKKEIKTVAEAKSAAAGGLLLSSELSSLLDRVKATNNQISINAIDTIKKYMVDMAPGATMTPAVGALNQVTLFRAIKSIIEFSKGDFQISFAALLRLFDEHKNGVFSERYVFRFMDNVSLNQDERKAFERILNLIKVAAPVAGRKEAVKQLNFQKTLANSFTDEGKQRILGFFNV